MDFKRFMVIMEYLDAGYPALMPGGDSALQSIFSSPIQVPKLELDLPAVTKTGKISLIIKDKNPILMQMSDGTQMYFTLDQYKRIKGNPEVGRTITVVFQRDPTDRSNLPSRINSCQVS